MPWARSLVLLGLLALAAGGLGVEAARPDFLTQPPAVGAGAPTTTPTATPGCGPQWEVVASPNVAPGDNRLFSIAATGPDDLWAVGANLHNSGAAQPAHTDALILHGTAAGWTVVPNLAMGVCTLWDVAGVAADDAWVTGWCGSNTPFTLHWDGVEWSVIPLPTGVSGVLYGIAARAANDVWAVGSAGHAESDNPLILHWDGTQWTEMAGPGGSPGFLARVAVVSANDVWAVGYLPNAYLRTATTLITHWDGQAWSVVPSPNVAGVGSYLYAVAAVAANDVWAVGWTSDNQPLSVHWDGTAWSIIPNANLGWPFKGLYGIAARASNDVWAAGINVLEHWDGSTWSVVASPRPNAPLYGATIGPGNDVWVAGYDYSGSDDQTLIMRYTDPCLPPTPTHSPTATPSPSPTRSATGTATRTATSTATRTATSTATPTVCPVQFNDVPPGSTFYTYVRCLARVGIVGGYPCGGPGEPCPGAYYRPTNNVTRGQVSKIVAESAGLNDPVPSSRQTFEDVPPGSTFWVWIERLSARGLISGYPCGGAGEPCIAPNNRLYFRPNNNVTRGQLSKITSGAAGWTETPTGQTFEDVPPGQTFYLFIEHMAARGVISGYPCGGPFEPCIAPNDRPYFRPNNNATRGQMSKIAAQAFFPACR